MYFIYQFSSQIKHFFHVQNEIAMTGNTHTHTHITLLVDFYACIEDTSIDLRLDRASS